MNSALVLPSAQKRAEFYNNDTRFCSYSQCSIAMWPAMIIHGHQYQNKGDTSKAGIEEALNHIGTDGFFVGTLSPGGVHHTECDPPNGLVEYAGGMAYVVWSWETIINWLTYGWPRPNPLNAGAPVGTWMWNDLGMYVDDTKPQPTYENLFPPFERDEALQLKKAGVPKDVIQGKRTLTEVEAVGVAARALSKQRAYRRRNKAFYRQHHNKAKTP
jgi:hypothetical protein